MARAVCGLLLLLVSFTALMAVLFDNGIKARYELIVQSAVFGVLGPALLLWGLSAIRKNRRLGRSPGRIRWWSSRLLLSELEAGAVDQLSLLRYFVFFTVFEIASWGLDTEVFGFEWNNNRRHLAWIGISIIAVKVVGPVFAYLANGGLNGQDFLQKFIACSHPIRVRATVFLLLAVALAPSLLVGFLKGFFGLNTLDLFHGSGVGLYWASFNILHIGMLCSLLRGARQSTANDRIA